jgi:hypothetical protein
MHSPPNHPSYQKPLAWKFITKLSTCGYDKLQGISKKPMPPTLFQDITNDNQGKYFHHYFTNCTSLWRKYKFAMQQIVHYNIMWWLIENVNTKLKQQNPSCKPKINITPKPTRPKEHFHNISKSGRMHIV